MANTINNSVPSDSKNSQVMDDYANIKPGVSGQQYDFVFSFFKKTMRDESAAATATEALFKIATQTNQNVVDLVNTLKNKDELEMTATLAYYLNDIRSSSTLLGVSVLASPNYYAARNVVS